MVRARKREKGLKEEENEKKKIFSAKRLFSRKCWRLVRNKGYKGKRRVSKKTEAPIAQAEIRTENRPNLKPKSPKNGARIFSFRREIFSTPAPKQKYSQTTFYSPKYTEFFRPERKDRIFGRNEKQNGHSVQFLLKFT
ncbi:hypothetical protein [Porphyromonas gulae]|nr:hypothetical protein HQ46_01985 [Porphyromonas gulae]